MGVIWTVFLLFSVLCAAVTGSAAALSGAIMDGANKGIQLALSLAGALCLWSGLARVMEQTGISSGLTRLLSPLLRKIFPHTWTDQEGREALCGNVTANLLGLGNAATPLGIRAVKSMKLSDCASDEMCRLIVMNTASIQLLPTTVAALRAGLGCSTPFDILPAVWVTSLCSVTAGLLAAKALRRWL